MGMPSVPQLLIILVIVVLIFGAKRLRNLGGDLGSAVKGFKQAVKDGEKDGDADDKPADGDAAQARITDDADAADTAAVREQEEQKKSA